MSLLEESREFIEIAFDIQDYIKALDKEKKDFINLEIDRLIDTYLSLQNLENYSTSKDIKITKTYVQKILVDLYALKNYTKKTYSVMYINPDRELIHYAIKGKHKEVAFKIQYTARPDNFNKYIKDKYGLKQTDLKRLLFDIIRIKTKYNKDEIIELIEKFFGTYKHSIETKYVAIVIPKATLNIPLTHLDNELRYAIYFKCDDFSTSETYNNLMIEDIESLLSHPHNQIKYLQ